MTDITLETTSARNQGLSPAAFLAALAGRLQEWQRRRQARQLLARIDARTLRDAGIDPGAAAYEVAQPFWVPVRSLRDTRF